MTPPKAPNPQIEAQIAALAASQHGIVTLTQLVALGVSRDAVKARVKSGRLHAMHRAVYSVGHTVVSVEGKRLAAVLACGPGAVLSHRSAAAQWGLRPSASPIVDVTVPTRAGRKRRAGIRLHRTTRLGEEEVTTHDRIPITTVARTLLDLAGILPHGDIDKAIERAEQLRLIDLTPLQAVVRANPGRRHPKIEPARALTRSELEVFLLDICAKHGLPTPRVNHYVEGHEVDFHWPDKRLIVEADGRETHDTQAAFERDRARDAELTAAGWRVVRFTYLQVTRTRGKVATVLAKLLR